VTVEVIRNKVFQPGIHTYPGVAIPVGTTRIHISMERLDWPDEGLVPVETTRVWVSYDAGQTWRASGESQSLGGTRFEEDGTTEKAISAMTIFPEQKDNPDRMIRGEVEAHFRFRSRVEAAWDSAVVPEFESTSSITVEAFKLVSGLNKTALTINGADFDVPAATDYLLAFNAAEDAFAGALTSVVRNGTDTFTELFDDVTGSTKVAIADWDESDGGGSIDSGQEDIVFSFVQDDLCMVACIALSGVDQTTPFRGTTFQNDVQGGGATSIAVTVTDSVNGDLVCAVAMGRDAANGNNDEGTLRGEIESAWQRHSGRPYYHGDRRESGHGVDLGRVGPTLLYRGDCAQAVGRTSCGWGY
jgi:hypothetical protein